MAKKKKLKKKIAELEARSKSYRDEIEVLVFDRYSPECAAIVGKYDHLRQLEKAIFAGSIKSTGDQRFQGLASLLGDDRGNSNTNKK